MFDDKKVGMIIPTRYYSERYPGKVLEKINGKPNLEIIIERVLQSKYVDKIILAISAKDKEKLTSWYNSKEYLQNNIPVYIFYGSHNDLMLRTTQAAVFYKLDIIAMISHCCTLVCPKMIDTFIQRMGVYEAEYSGNAITRTFPDGFDLQVFTKDLYERVNDLIPEGHRTRMWTHWNIWHWREEINPKPRIINREAPVSMYHPDWHLCFDTKEDKIVLENIFKAFNNFTFDHIDLMQFLYRHPEILNHNKNVKPTKLLKEGNK